jgi:hypothetical protein
MVLQATHRPVRRSKLLLPARVDKRPVRNLAYNDYKCLIYFLPYFPTRLNNTHILGWYSNVRKTKKWEESEIRNQQ